jgi:hypothetical protein
MESFLAVKKSLTMLPMFGIFLSGMEKAILQGKKRMA